MVVRKPIDKVVRKELTRLFPSVSHISFFAIPLLPFFSIPLLFLSYPPPISLLSPSYPPPHFSHQVCHPFSVKIQVRKLSPRPRASGLPSSALPVLLVSWTSGRLLISKLDRRQEFAFRNNKEGYRRNFFPAWAEEGRKDGIEERRGGKEKRQGNKYKEEGSLGKG